MWFKVDDGLAFHHKVVRAGNAAMGLWVRAGAWCAAEEQDGLVSDEIVASLGGTSLAAKLTKVGLWYREPGGYRFHDWHVFQPSARDLQLAREKESESGVKGNHVKWHVKRGIVNPDCPLCGGES